MSEYPPHWETDAVLADGGTVHVRPIVPEDAERIIDLNTRLSDRSIYYRFFSPRRVLSERELHRFTHVDHDDRVALVAVLDGRLIAVARYDRHPATSEAEVAFVVADEHQGRGLGTLLLEHLAAAARERGVTRFVAETLPDNRAMQSVFRQAGWTSKSRFSDGVIAVEFPIDPTPEAIAKQQVREQRADARSVARLLHPSSIAVVGASRRPDALGHEVFRNLVDGGFTGPVYPVNRDADEVSDVTAWSSLLAVPDAIDLVVITTPAAEVPGIVEDCVAKRVQSIVIISTGFGDRDAAGLEVERAIVRRARGAGIRVVGPASMGVLNTDPAVSMAGVIGGTPVPAGRVGILSQSGALGVGLLRWATRTGLGVSSFVAVGNKADVSGNDVLQHWDEDPRTDVVLLYLESFGNPRKFARVARRVARHKPVLAVRAGADPTVDALFRQTGVVRVDSPERLFEAASVLATQPLPGGRSVAIVADAGGPALLAAAAVESAGLRVDATSEIAFDAAPGAFPAAVERAIATQSVDAVIVVLTDISPDEVIPTGAKPVLVTVLSPDAFEVGAFPSPEAAAHALAAAVRYADWRSRPDSGTRALDEVDNEAARLLVDAALFSSPDGIALGAAESAHLLGAFGVAIGGDAPTDAVELRVQVDQHPTFGPVITLCVGGPAAALIDDRASSITPLTPIDARDLAWSLRTAPQLFASLDLDPLDDLLLRVSRLVEDVPEADSFVLEPVCLGAGGVVVGSASVHLARWKPHPDLALRRLR